MDARWYSSDLARFTSPDYYNLQQLALPAGARHQLLPYLGKNYQDLLRDPAQQMRYGYVMGNGLTYLNWLGLCSEPNLFVKAIYTTSAALDGVYDTVSFGLYSDLANSAGIPTGRNANSTAYQLGQSAATGAEIGASLGVVPLAKSGVRNLGKQISKGLTKQVDEAADTTLPQVTRNRHQGNLGEEIVEENLKDQGTFTGRQVTLETSKGAKSRIDLVENTPSGGTRINEVKTGNADLTANQSDLFDDVANATPVIPRGKNAADAGLTPGLPIIIDEAVITRLTPLQ